MGQKSYRKFIDADKILFLKVDKEQPQILGKLNHREVILYD
jgi:hypothetical protein